MATYEFPARGYYQLQFAQDALVARLQAIEHAVPPRAKVLDLGCNDGRVSRHLLERGLAQHVTAVDLVDMMPDKPAGLSFIQADLCRGDFDRLPSQVDVVLFLNVAHHLVCESAQLAKAAVKRMLAISPMVLLDMGSFTEQGDWRWRSEYERHWRNDAEMWAELFESAAARRPLLVYPAQAGGNRVLWQLDAQKKSAAITGYRVHGCYRRTVASEPQFKRLVNVNSLTDKLEMFGSQIGQLCPDVIFYVLEGSDGSLYWSKKWLNGRTWLEAATVSVESFLRTLARNDLCLAVNVHADFGMIYPFNEELFASTTIVHQWDRKSFFNANECAGIEQFAATSVRANGLPWRSLGELTDFQVVQTGAGLMFLDFEPAAHMRGL